MLAKPKPRDGEIEALGRAASLDALYGHLPAEKIVEGICIVALGSMGRHGGAPVVKRR